MIYLRFIEYMFRASLVARTVNERDLALIPGLGRSPGGGHGNPSTSVFLPEESHGHRSLAGYCPWGRKESDTTERPSTAHSTGLECRFSNFQPVFFSPCTAGKKILKHIHIHTFISLAFPNLKNIPKEAFGRIQRLLWQL